MAVQVPFLPDEEIEAAANELLARYGREREPIIDPPIRADDRILPYLKLRLELDDLHRRLNVPKRGDGPDILGALWFPDRLVVVHQDLDPERNTQQEGRYNFTVGHEIGHWVLHRHIIEASAKQMSLLGTDPTPSFICRHSEAKRPVEWQADRYSSYLLMPKVMVLKVWKAEMGSDRAIPSTRPDQQERAAKKVAFVFKTSVHATRIRLKDLQLLPHEERQDLGL